MAVNVAHRLGQGLSPKAFVSTMKHNNLDREKERGIRDTLLKNGGIVCRGCI